MSNWLLKTAIQRGISWLPGGLAINEFLQRRVTGSLALGEGQVECTLKEVDRLMRQFGTRASTGSDEFTALELGTGWYPIFRWRYTSAGRVAFGPATSCPTSILND